MAKLSDEQKTALAELEALRDAPDDPEPPKHGRMENVNVTIDLGDEAQVARALRLGLLKESDVKDAPADDDAPPPDDDPKRGSRY